MVETQRRMAVHPVPFGPCVMENLGRGYRVLRGEGCFAGKGAYEQFRRLAEVFQDNRPGLLVHPVWRTEKAWFVSLTVKEEPLPDYVRYSFEFWEDWDGFHTGLTEVKAPGTSGGGSGAGTTVPEGTSLYLVRKGDTLWGIAKRYGVPLTALIAANPQIKNPNLIYPGDRVRIP